MVSTRPLTADDLFQLGSDAPYELIEGELIEVSPQGRVHGRILSKLNSILDNEIVTDEMGELLVGDVGFVLSRNPDTVLAPDLAFVRAERLRDAGDGYLELSPDLAIEVVSPGNTLAEISRKTELYLTHGSIEVWVVRPQDREIIVHRRDGRSEIFRNGENLSSALFPEHGIDLDRIFPIR